MPGIEAYGLNDEKVLKVATELAPELFAALELAEKMEDARFPLETDRDIEAVVATSAGEGGAFESPGVRISGDDARDRFPDEFLPVEDRYDLVRKIYMAIVIAHQADSRERVAKVRAEGGAVASHPFDLEVL